MSRWPLRPSLRPELALALILLALPGGARAQRPAPTDEPTGLMVAKVGTGLRLTWQRAQDSVSAYQVRRCLLPSLRVPYYGNCVATGLRATTWDDTSPPAGNVFYLVSSFVAGAEGSLGFSFDGEAWAPRRAPPCTAPTVPGPLLLTISVDADAHVCGTEVIVTYPDWAMTYEVGSGACVGVTDGFLGETNDTVSGVLAHTCASTLSPRAPGSITEFRFQRGECPVTVDAFRILKCNVLVGEPDCDGDLTLQVMTCQLR